MIMIQLQPLLQLPASFLHNHPMINIITTITPYSLPGSLNLYATAFGEICLEDTIVGGPILCQATINISLATVVILIDAFELMQWPNSIMSHVKRVVESVTNRG